MHCTPIAPREAQRIAERLTLQGRVQGVGVRPAVARLAAELGLTGCVRNSPVGVEIEVEGSPAALVAFRARVADALPSEAVLRQIDRERVSPSGVVSFCIEPSLPSGPLATPVPTDRAVCADCLADVADAGDRRRHGYAFTSCTACGPRYSLIDAMPYDRAATSMARFEMCMACDGEYHAPADRRFHAQTNACARCGPQLTGGPEPLNRALEALVAGHIVALRGVGGYQLLCDATSDAAVTRLRERKHRPTKPLAVLVASLADAARLALLSDDERLAMAALSNAIVVAPRRPDAPLAAGVCGPFDTVGLMLPTTPLHATLAERSGRPLVCTSGNREGEPLAFDSSYARDQLSEIADAWLDHDRPIVRPIDDSVVRLIAGRAVSLRRARGLAPLPLDLPAPFPALAVGGHQKSAIAISNGLQAALGPHIGDLDTAATRQRFVEHVHALTTLYGARPELIVHDLHPYYFTTRWAAEQGIPTLAVQHHHAHAVAAMLEHGWLDREVLAVTWDGTGCGPDGTIWGGEFLLATATEFQRVTHLRPFRLPGGEAAIHQPWRAAVGLLRQSMAVEDLVRVLPDIEPHNIAQIASLAERPTLSPLTTSIGRLFDAIAAVVLGLRVAEFEGQPAMLLEAACDPTAPGSYTLPLAEGSPTALDWRPLLSELLADRAAGAMPGAMAIRFHRALAAAVIEVARRFAPRPVVLAGGVFQNRVLVELIAERWPHVRQPLGLPGTIPPGDGGLAAGQLAMALSHNHQRGTRPCA